MAATTFTPISLYFSATATNVPLAANLVAGELALNTADGKLFYKDSSNVVQVLGTKGGVGSSTTTQVLYNSSGLTVGSANMVFNGTLLTSSFAGPINGTIGATTPAAGAFTAVTATGVISGRNTNGQAFNTGNGVDSDFGIFNQTGNILLANSGATSAISFATAGSTRLVINNSGLAVTGAISATAANGNNDLALSATAGIPILSLLGQSGSIPVLGYSGGVGLRIGTVTGIGAAGLVEQIRLDASGNLGLGISAVAGVKLQVKAAINQNFGVISQGGTVTISGFTDAGSSAPLRVAGNVLTLSGDGTNEHVRIDASGNFFVGRSFLGFNNSTGSSIGFGGNVISEGANTRSQLNRTTTDGALINFYRQGVEVGSVSVTGTATTYFTSSDYRLKNNQQPLTGSGAFVDALKPTTWDWVQDGSAGVGFIAHEFQAVSPGSVSGTKDETTLEQYEVTPATDTEPAVMGERTVPKYQAMQASSAEVMANIVAELQSLRARLAVLESK